MTNDQIKINRVDLHTSCPISERIKRLESQLENRWKYTAALEEDLEDQRKHTTDLGCQLDYQRKYAADLECQLEDQRKYAADLECQLEDQQKYTADLERDLEDRDALIENLGADLQTVRDENNRLNGKFYEARVELGHLRRLNDSRDRLLSDLRPSLAEILKGIGE